MRTEGDKTATSEKTIEKTDNLSVSGRLGNGDKKLERRPLNSKQKSEETINRKQKPVGKIAVSLSSSDSDTELLCRKVYGLS